MNNLLKKIHRIRMLSGLDVMIIFCNIKILLKLQPYYSNLYNIEPLYIYFLGIYNVLMFCCVINSLDKIDRVTCGFVVPFVFFSILQTRRHWQQSTCRCNSYCTSMKILLAESWVRASGYFSFWPILRPWIWNYHRWYQGRKC